MTTPPKKNIPAFRTPIADLSKYDTVFIGFPVWGGCMPKFEQEYIKKCNFKNKTVIPFATAGSNGEKRAYANISNYFYN